MQIITETRVLLNLRLPLIIAVFAMSHNYYYRWITHHITASLPVAELYTGFFKRDRQMISMNHKITFSRNVVFFLIIISTLILSASGAVTSSKSSSMTSSSFWDGNTDGVWDGVSLPIRSDLSISSSTTTQDQPSSGSGQSTSVNDPYGGILSESRLYLDKGQHSQHLIRFNNYGQIQVQAQEGATFDLYSKKGGSWPNSSTFKTNYDQTMKVTSLNPAVMKVGPGIWVFTIDSPDQGGAYSLAAFQNADENQQTVSQSSDVALKTVTYAEPFPTTNTTS